MKVPTRRTFLAGLAAASCWSAPPESALYEGVELGLQSFSLKDRALDRMIEDCVSIGIRSVELWSGHLEPPREQYSKGRREIVRRWRIEQGVDACNEARNKFGRAGVHLNSFNLSLRNDATDEEIDAAFQMTRALGVDILTSSSNVSTAARLDPYARRYRIKVGFHNHARIKDDEFATPRDFQLATEGFSEYLGINLDTGHFHAAGFDNLDFLKRNHGRIFTLHMKDRKAHDGPKVPFGQGSTPLAAILRLLRDNEWKIPANIEMAYPTEDPLREISESLTYMRQALEA